MWFVTVYEFVCELTACDFRIGTTADTYYYYPGLPAAAHLQWFRNCNWWQLWTAADDLLCSSTLFTAKDISYLVRVRYCKAPTTHRYWVASIGPKVFIHEQIVFSLVWHRRTDRLAIPHTSSLQKIRSIFFLNGNNTISYFMNFRK
jgi:hypothetical protein